LSPIDYISFKGKALDFEITANYKMFHSMYLETWVWQPAVQSLVLASAVKTKVQWCWNWIVLMLGSYENVTPRWQQYHNCSLPEEEVLCGFLF
jgi:hypothetical protein